MAKKPFSGAKKAWRKFKKDFKKSFYQAKQDPKQAWKDICKGFVEFWTPKRVYFAVSALAAWLLAPALVIFLEYRQRIYNIESTFKFATEHPEIFHYTCTIMLLLGLTSIAIFKSVLKGEAVLVALITAITFVHINKFQARDFPLLPEDLQMATEAQSLSQMVNIWDVVITVAAMVAVLVGAWCLQRFIDRKLALKYKTKKVATFRLLLGFVSVFLLLTTIAPIRSINDRRTYVEFLDTEIVAWNQVENYQRNGFLVGFIYNIGSKKMAEPTFAKYNSENIKKIVDKYKKVADEHNKSKKSLADENVNILYVMNESFSDPNRFKDTYPFTGENPVPNLNALQTNTHTSFGYIQGAEYGGGTANVEFEALTGLSNYFLGVVPYVQIMSKKTNFPALPSFLNSQGYTSTGLHPYSGNMYKRNIVYKNLGFKTFIDRDGFTFRDVEPNTNNYISDESAYKQALQQLGSGDKQFVTLITMQNHMPYTDIYKKLAYKSTATDVSKSANDAIANYLQTLHSADEALGKLVKQIDETKQKTVLVFWGDHLPGLYSNLEGSDLKYQTPILVYSNFGDGKKLGVISSNYISLELLNYIDVKMPAYYYLLADTKKADPVLAKSYFENKSPKETDELKDYEMIEYDLLSGKQYSKKFGLFDL